MPRAIPFRRAITAAIAALLLGAFPASAPASASPPTEAELFARLGRLESLESAFVQKKTLRIFTQPQRSEGRLSFARDGSLVWEYISPQRSSLTLAAGKVTMSYPDLGRSEEFDLARSPGMKGIIESMFLWLKADPAALRKDYEVRLVTTPGTELRLVPRDDGMRKYIAGLSFTFGDDLLVRRLVISEPDGDTTDIEFTSQKAVDRSAP